MTTNKRAVAAVAVAVVACVVAWQLTRAQERLYEGRTLAQWAEESVLEHGHADSVLIQAISANPELLTQVERQTEAGAIRLLRTRDNPFWKPYTVVRGCAPAALSKRMPEWREPKEVRLEAANWLAGVARRGQSVFMPALSEAAGRDPDPRVKALAIHALSEIGLYSEDVLAIMLKALTTSTNSGNRTDAARWFRRTTPQPQRIVPILVRGLADPAWKSEYALALRGYGAKAKFAVGPISALAPTDDPAVSSVAQWALEAIDAEAAAKAQSQ